MVPLAGLASPRGELEGTQPLALVADAPDAGAGAGLLEVALPKMGVPKSLGSMGDYRPL